MYPIASATGICVQRFAELLCNDYKIDVICVASDMNAVRIAHMSGITIHALAGGAMSQEAHHRGVLRKLCHLYGQAQIKTSLLGNMKWFEVAALKKLKEIDRIRKIDAIFSVCSPLSAHCAALKYKEENASVRWLAYTVDLFATPKRIRPFGHSLESLIKKEQEVLQKADSVLLSEEIYANHPKLVENLKDVEKLPYAIPYQKESEDFKEELGSSKKNRIYCVFAGTLYQDLRNPEVMLDLFSRISDKTVNLHLYTTGCGELVGKYASNVNSITLHGRVPYEEIKRVYQKADFLVNIGNSNSDFIPSKTFEYIATGKPIINFYYGNKPDSVLSKYPLAFHISNKEKQHEVKPIEEFLKSNTGKVLSRRDIEQIYPCNATDYIKNLLKNKID